MCLMESGRCRLVVRRLAAAGVLGELKSRQVADIVVDGLDKCSVPDNVLRALGRGDWTTPEEHFVVGVPPVGRG